MGDDQSVTAVFSKRAVTLTAVADPGSNLINGPENVLLKSNVLPARLILASVELNAILQWAVINR